MATRIYKRHMAEDEWQYYLNLSRDECRREGITFSPMGAPDPYVEFNDNAFFDELLRESELYAEYMDYYNSRQSLRGFPHEEDCG